MTAPGPNSKYTMSLEEIDRKRAIIQEIVDNSESEADLIAWEDKIAQHVVSNLPSLRRFLKYDIAHTSDLTMVCQAVREVSEGIAARLNDQRYSGRERIAALAMHKLCNYET